MWTSLNGIELNRYDAAVLRLGGGNETTRVHQDHCRFGSHGLADRCARAAADAYRRPAQQYVGGTIQAVR